MPASRVGSGVNRVIAVVLVSACAGAAAEPPPHGRELAAWASSAGVTLSSHRECDGLGELHFGALGAVCWAAKSMTEQPPRGSRMFPRFEIVVATYGSEAAARARMARFHDVPAPLEAPAGKAYPLRAGFRVGARVVVVTTDAFAFEPDAYRAAAGLAKAIGGVELTCWTPCEPSAS